MRTWPGRGQSADTVYSVTGHDHGQQAGLWRGFSASKPRSLRGHQVLHWRRGKACTREKPSSEGNKWRQMRRGKWRHIATKSLPHFDTGANTARFVGRMV